MPGVYREHAPPRGLDHLVACVWTSHDEEVRVLPDACVDVVWSAGRAVVAGPATRAVVAPATPGQPRVGVRFRVGAAGAALGVPADALRDLDVELADVWGRATATRIADGIQTAPSVEAAATALAAGVAERAQRGDEPDRLVRAAAETLWGDLRTPGGRKSTHPSEGAAALARELGLSERQLLRRFRSAVGYGPRTLTRVQRLQRFLALAAAAPGTPLARLALDAGYADQAHLARECQALAEAPPTALVAAGATPAGDPTLTHAAATPSAEPA